VDAAAYLLDFLWEIGPTLLAGMGTGPITFGEIRAWTELTGVELDPWEVRFLRRLSHEYLSESHNATKRGAPAPWRAADAPPEISETQSRLRLLAQL